MSDWIDKAFKLREMSKSRLAKVGAVLVKDGKVISLAFNSDVHNQLEELEDLQDGKLITKPEVIHAEERCIADAARFGESTNNAELYVTLAPCFKCSRLILASGINKVYYREEWWDKNAIKYLKNNSVRVEKI